MAGRNLGTLTIDLVAKTGGFVSGLTQAERASQKWSKQVQADAAASAKALVAVGAAVAASALAVGTAGFNFLKNTAKQVTETDRWAKSLNMSTQELLAWQFAAEKAGVTGDNIADIFKDINDKIGDAVLNKSGEAVDALNALGLSAEKLSKVSPDKQLMAISQALSKIGTTAEKTNILESLGNDLSKLLPLFDNNNEKLKQFLDLAKDYGVAPDPSSIDDLVKVNQLFEDMEAQVNGVKMEIATGLAKVDLSPLQNSISEIGDILTDPVVLQGIVNLVSEVAELAGWIIRVASGLGSIAGYTVSRMNALSGKYNAADTGDVTERINLLNSRDNKSNEEEKELEFLQKRLRFLNALKNTQPTINQNASFGGLLSDMGIDEPKAGFSLGKGEVNGKPPKSKTSKSDNSFKTTEQSLLRQINLIDITGKKINEVSEIQKVEFDIANGKLSGLNYKQKERIKQLAKELDRVTALKKANEENLKVASFVANLESENRNAKAGLDIGISGSWLGGKEQERMRERLNIQEEYINKQSDLQKQYQAGDITKSLYDKETEALNSSLQERLKIQEDHYKKIDELQNNGTAGFVSGVATQMESSMDLYSNMQQAGSAAFSGLTDMIVNWAETGKLNAQSFAATFLQSVGGALLSYAAAQVAMAGLEAFTAMVGIPFVGPAVAPGAAIAAAAAAGALAMGVGAALTGQAHDGIDSVPETGTWLLQKGERVVTSNTSAKLDATLDRVSRDTSGGNVYAPNLNFNVNGDPSDAQIAMMKKATADGARLGYQQAASDLYNGRGKISAAMSKWNGGRKIR